MATADNGHETADTTSAVDEGRIALTVRRAEEVFFVAVLVALILLGLAPMLTRIFHLPSISWSEPASRQLMIWIALFGAATAAHDRKHIAIDAISHFLPVRGKLVLSAATSVLSTLVCAYLTYLGLEFIPLMREEAQFSGEATAFLRIPKWWLPTVIPIGFAILSVRMFICAVQDIVAWNRGRGEPVSSG